MKDFQYIQPETVEDATAALSHKGNSEWSNTKTRVFAGGQDLLGEMKAGLEEPAALVNIKWIPGLDSTSQAAGGNVKFGATTKLRSIEDLFQGGAFRALSEAAKSIASPQIRTNATVAGNLCQRPRCLYYRRPEALCYKKGGDECFAYGGNNKYNAILGGGPSFIVHPSDMAPALVAMDAIIEIQDPQGPRELLLEDFYTLPSEGDVTRETVLMPDEIVLSLTTGLDSPREWRSTYLKHQERDGFDFALSAVAISLRVQGGSITDARVVLGGVAPRPWRCREAEQILKGSMDKASLAARAAAAAESALAGAEPLEHNAYKVPLTKGLIQRAVRHLTAL
jgi:xanthine dehydrogenase YagS FAD-binding subunit